MQANFSKDLDSLDQIVQFAERFVSQHKLGRATALRINLVIEELFVTVVKDDIGSPGDIEVSLKQVDDRLIIGLSGKGRFFDPARVNSAPDNENPGAETREGLRLRLIKQAVDEIKYEYKDGTSRVTAVRRLDKGESAGKGRNQDKVSMRGPSD